MLKLEDVLSDIARLSKEHDAALEEHDDCIEAIDAKVGHPKYDAIMEEVHTDELTCKELRWAVRAASCFCLRPPAPFAHSRLSHRCVPTPLACASCHAGQEMGKRGQGHYGRTY